MRVLHVVAETPLSFLQHLKDITYIERRPLRSVAICSNTQSLTGRQILRRTIAVINTHSGAESFGRVFCTTKSSWFRDLGIDLRER